MPDLAGAVGDNDTALRRVGQFSAPTRKMSAGQLIEDPTRAMRPRSGAGRGARVKARPAAANGQGRAVSNEAGRRPILHLPAAIG